MVCLGETGINFGAGMSGGVAYMYDPAKVLPPHVNRGMVLLEAIATEEEAAELRGYIEAHAAKTDSAVAARVLAQWPSSLSDFVKVMPEDYKRVLAEQAAARGAEDAAAAA